MIETLAPDDALKYLGRILNLESDECIGYTMTYRKTLDTHIPLRLHLRLFDADSTPTILCGIEVANAQKRYIEDPRRIQRRILRRIIGWRRIQDES